MPTGDETLLPSTVKSTATDGFDSLTVDAAHAMSPIEFERLFGYAGLDAVPCVHPDLLAKAPRGCEWYVRHRPAPKNPKPRDRKVDAFELVVKERERELPGGGTTVDPKRVIALQSKEPDAARLEAVIFLARRQGRRRRATSWPIEKIQGLLVCDVLEHYAGVYLLNPPEEEKKRVGNHTRRSYLSGVRAFQKAFPALEVGDISDWIPEMYDMRASHRTLRTRTSDQHASRRGVKLGLKLLGVANYDSNWTIPDPGMLDKIKWTPDQFDRLKAAADGYLFEADGSPKMVAGMDGPVQMRRDRRSINYRKAWRRGIPFLTYTVSRHGRLAKTRWLPPEVDPMDGQPLPENDRPWLEVLEDRILYHRDGETRVDSTKGRDGNQIPKEFEAEVRSWYEEDMACGQEWVFHQRDGSRFTDWHIGKEAFRNIVADAGLDMRRVPHHFKDLSVQISDEAGIGREVLAAHADTTVRTLEKKYGEPAREALLAHAADKFSQKAWRERAARKAEVTQLFAENRAKAMAGKSSKRIKAADAAAKVTKAAETEATAAGRTDARSRPPDGRLRAAG